MSAACYLVFEPGAGPILPFVMHAHDPAYLGQYPEGVVVPMSQCVVNPGVVEISFDRDNNVVIITPVGGGAALSHVFVGLGSAAELEEKDGAADDW